VSKPANEPAKEMLPTDLHISKEDDNDEMNIS